MHGTCCVLSRGVSSLERSSLSFKSMTTVHVYMYICQMDDGIMKSFIFVLYI